MFKVETKVYDNGDISMVTRDTLFQQSATELCRTKEAAIRDALIKLGWVPPDLAVKPAAEVTETAVMLDGTPIFNGNGDVAVGQKLFAHPDPEAIRLLLEADAKIGQLRAALIEMDHHADQLEKERDHWKANHDNRVAAARLLIERPDLPLERIPAYQDYLTLQEQDATQRIEYSKTLDQMQGMQHLIDELTAQRDTYRAALLWVLYNHQGASSPTGQPIRRVLSIGQFDRLTSDQSREAILFAKGTET